jgi:hypothetical protein
MKFIQEMWGKKIESNNTKLWNRKKIRRTYKK